MPAVVIDLCCSSDEEEETTSNKNNNHHRHPAQDINNNNNDKIDTDENTNKSINNNNKKQKRPSTPGSSDRPRKRPRAPPVVYLSPHDAGVTVDGLLRYLPRLPRVVSCAGRTTNNNSDDDTTMLHIQQPDKWSCGYRNLQMLLTAILPLLPVEHSFWGQGHVLFADAADAAADNAHHNSNYTNNTIQFGAGAYEIPSVARLQRSLCAAWRAGFDRDGCGHYARGRRLANAWIGAVEVASLLSFAGLDATVVQFQACRLSRELVLPFCVAYCLWQQQHHDHPWTTTTGSRELAQQLLAQASRRRRHDNNNNKAHRFLIMDEAVAAVVDSDQTTASGGGGLPLYLQWHGHSVSVVGFEVVPNTKKANLATTAHDIFLLVLDPIKSGRTLQRALQQGNCKPLRLQLRQLQQKDCQIVLCSTAPLSPAVREQTKVCVQNVTAAETAVRAARAK